jgi:hypothetical protein
MVHSQVKGKAYEQKINRIINQYFDFRDKQKLVRTSVMGGDFKNEDSMSYAHNFFTDTFWIEMKNREAGNVYNWYETSKSKKPIGNTKIPIVIHTRNFFGDFVTLSLEDFLYIVSKIKEIK